MIFTYKFRKILKAHLLINLPSIILLYWLHYHNNDMNLKILKTKQIILELSKTL